VKFKNKDTKTRDLNYVSESWRMLHLYEFVYKFSCKQCYVTVILTTWFLYRKFSIVETYQSI